MAYRFSALVAKRGSKAPSGSPIESGDPPGPFHRHEVRIIQSRPSCSRCTARWRARSSRISRCVVLVVFLYSLLFTSLISFFAVMIIPDKVRMSQYSGNLIGGLVDECRRAGAGALLGPQRVWWWLVGSLILPRLSTRRSSGPTAS